MKTEIIGTEGFSIFVNPILKVKLDSGSELETTLQVIIVKNKEGKFIHDDVDIIEITKIKLMGVDIDEPTKISETHKYFKGMGINLYEVARDEMKKEIDRMGVKQFVLKQTGITLR